MYLPDLYGDGSVRLFDFDADAIFEVRDDGTATLTGTARQQGAQGRALSVDFEFAGRTATPPPGSPKNNFGYDTSDWIYYPDWNGTLTGADDLAGAELAVSRRGASFQIGTGANDQGNQGDVYGGSAWLDWDRTSQADGCGNGGKCIDSRGIGDLNMRLKDCESASALRNPVPARTLTLEKMLRPRR